MSMRHLKGAFEAYDDAPQTDGKIEMKGPLSEIYSRALMAVYKRTVAPNDPDEKDISPSNETAANDELMLQRLASAVLGPDTETPTGSILYGVDRSEIAPSDVVSITKEYETNPDRPVVLIMDGTDPGPNSPDDSEPSAKLKYLAEAMESICRASGGGVYPSLEAYARERYKS